MSSHGFRLPRRALAPMCFFALALPAVPVPAGATTRLAPVATRDAAKTASSRRAGVPVGVRLTAGANGEYYGAGTLKADPLSPFGSVLRIDASGTVTSVHDFAGSDGVRPVGTVTLARDGFLYGVTASGGQGQAGTIYRVRPDGSEFATIHAFTGGPDGASPSAGLTETRTGLLVGTASAGGVNGRGVIFQIDAARSFAVLHDFTAAEGSAPSVALVEPASGVLFGATRGGGAADFGTVFTIRTNGSSFRTVHEFTAAEGGAPETELVRGADGMLYGAAAWGGVFDNGTIFRVSSDGVRFERVHAFDAAASETPRLADKSHPVTLALGPDGRLYGTTLTSATSSRGEVFAIRPDTGDFVSVAGFAASADPRAGFVRGADGALYVPTFDTSTRGGVTMRLAPLTAGGAKIGSDASVASAPVLPPVGGASQKTDATNGVPICTNPWTAATPYPIGIGRYAFAQNGETLYVFGGVADGVIVATSNSYNTGTNAWTPIADDPILGEAGTAAYLDGKIYHAQGALQGQSESGFAIYDVAGNTWTPGPAVPGQPDRFGAASGAFNGNYFVVGGGSSSSSGSADVQVYNIASNTWSAGTAAPSSYELGGYVQVGQYLYCVGSYGPSTSANSMVTMRLDMSTAPGVWTTGPAWTPALADFGLAYQNGKLFAMGGETNGGGFFDASTPVNELDTAAWPGGAWVASPPILPGPRQGNQAGFVATTGRAGGEIWSTGGIFGRNTHTWINDHIYRSTGPDATPPTITCPGTIVAGEAPMGSGSAVVNFTVNATDNCSTPTVVCTPASGSTFVLGMTEVTCTATDGAGLTATCGFTVNVVESTFTNCYVDDATGNVLSIDLGPTSGSYGQWQLLIVATGTTVTGTAETIAYVPNRSLTAHDHDSTTSSLDLNVSFSSKTATATVVNLLTGQRYVLRDRNITNDPPCGAVAPPVRP